ncbi:myosin vii xv [Holotrichia oblita]|uniref:Myosin vii xv n=2 Tax=Holotrichia oblita TaxID=644536 RepID=A0ACB9TD68_HOLOL|nr:myosin vii xv [Holotrichia oblita]
MTNLDNLVVGDYIWIHPTTAGEFDVPSGGKILAIEAKRLRIKSDTGSEIYIGKEQVFKPIHISSIKIVEDMINLGDLQEYSILRNLHIRYLDKLIYTYTGTMLVAINPYEVLPIYTNAIIKEYKDNKLGELPPHIFAIGDSAYNEMKTMSKDQCVVISGESGAGKTESTKLILQYLASTSGKHSWIEQQILEANPILEAFGNAKTVRNDNSSRFGKYIDINFNKNGQIEGAKIDQYLLEKSRIVSQSEGERNYHIFYSLLAGLTKEEKSRLELSDASKYVYLNKGKCLTCDGRNEVSEFGEIREAFKILNFSEKEVSDVFQLLACILHFGNLKFKKTIVANMEASEIAEPTAVSKIAVFLGTNKFDLSEALTKRTIFVHGEKVVTNLSDTQAYEARDAFVKGIYGKLFIAIVEKLNSVIYQPKVSRKTSIGVLDIFGFENFGVNSFEQLCINYANENLQQFFVQHIFKLEQDYYTKEGINWKHIVFVDNQEILDMIGTKSMNILSLIDEESKFPKGTDFTMLAKLNNTHGRKSNYLQSKSNLEPLFGIKHFAGSVHYHVPEFKDEVKGKKTLSSQFRFSLEALMRTLNACHPYFIRCIKPNENKRPLEFDRALCCRQLRYSGMMETAKIRQAGYPIRHDYFNFVNRFRYLAPNILPAHKGNPRESARSICQAVFKNNEDYQLGNTKVFLKHVDNERLEEERAKILARYIIVLQRHIRGFLCRNRYKKMKESALVIQKHWRGRGYRGRFLKMRYGFKRLQARLASRQLTYAFNRDREAILKLQTISRGYLARQKKPIGQIYNIVKLRNVEERELKKAGNKNYKHAAEVNMQKRLAEINRAYIVKQKLKPDEPQPNELVDNLFDFLKDNEVAPSSTDIKESEEFLNQLNKKSRETEEETEEREDLSAYNFNKFAATYFRKNVNPAYSKKPLKESLLELPTPDDVIAAQALWITILRFTGDLPEPRYESETKVITENDTIMSKVTETLSRSFTNRKEFQEILRQEQAYSKYSKAERQKYISMTLKRKSKLLDDVRHGMVEDRFANEMYREWIHDKRTTNLEKLHFIIGHGILRQELRDEIFCQICKILTANPTKASHARGWILLSLCVGCFPPSERLVLYLKAFMRSGPPGYAPYCEGRLNRTFKNGARTQPPSWLELHATKNKQPINLQITFMDKTTVTIEADSATTSAEVCENIAMNLNLTDTFGFSLFITLYDKVMSLGSDNDHIMDAISQCEQYAKEQGKQERSAPWKLFYRKEIFTPWHDPAADAVATNLIYHQIIRGLKFGEYRCPNEGDVATLVAQQYYIENGPVIQPKVLHTRIGEYTPTYMVQKGEYSEEWEKKIIDSFNRSTCVKETKPALRAKEDIVKYGKLVWPILFSKFYEAIKISGPELPKDNMIIAINWTGIYMIDDQEQILMEMTFADVAYVNYQQNAQFQLHNITFSTIRNEEYVFQSPDAENMYNLIIYLIDGLKERSVYVVAMQDYKHPGEAASFLSYKKGDLIVLKNGFTGSDLKSSAWGNGECNGRVGDFITEHVYILPTLYKPPADILQAFKKDGAFEARQPTAPVISTIRRMKVHTLAQYANDHFRSSRRLTVNKTSVLNTVRRASKEELWKYTNQPVYQPLLQKVLEDSNLSKQAVEAFTAILKYMGDMPAPKSKICNELTDVIFAGCFSHDLLKDEIYCQIMRQLTYNRLSSSEEKGWELLYLATGLFSCSPSLMSDLTKFIQSRVHPFVEPCLQRLQRSSKIGARKYPPYSVEVDAIQHRSLQIYHKVYFPDDNDEAFEVDSLTKASDLCKAIAERLGLNSYDGFSLMVMITDKVFSIPDNYYFYDFLHELIDWVKESKPSWNSGAPVQAQYQVFFMKKLWINTIPGRDLAADHIFHYHQEMPKYIRGYHKCSKLDAVKLAALILRVRHKARTNEAFESLTHEKEIREVVPIDLFKAQSMSEWKKQITVAYNTDGKMTELEAKSKFLEVIYQWPTFGSTFFEVKQSSEPSHPEIILIAINKNGVNVIHPQTKDILVTHDFSELTNWSSGNTYFHITVGNAMRRLKYLYETAQGYKMDDLITSYVDFISNTTKKDNKPFIF